MSNYNHHGDLPELLKGKGIYRKAKSLLMKIARILNRIEVRWHEGNSDDTFFDKSGDEWLLELPRPTSVHNFVVCTGADAGGDGYHEFTECNLAGNSVEDGTIYSDCWLIGDWTRGEWLPIEYGLSSGEEPTYGLLYNINGFNAVQVLGNFYID